MVVLAYDPSTQEAEKGEFLVYERLGYTECSRRAEAVQHGPNSKG